MRKFLISTMAAAVLMMMFGSVLNAAPDYGTVSGDTWTSELLDFTYSITPVPETVELGDETSLSLARGSVITISSADTDVSVYAITDFDYSLMREHAIEGPVFTGKAYTFGEPGQYLIFFVTGSDFRAGFDLEVN